MEGSVKISLDDFMELQEKAQVYDEIYTLLADETDAEIKSNKEKAQRTEYLIGSVYIDVEKICDITGWNFAEIFNEQRKKADELRSKIIQSKMAKPVVISVEVNEG